jgi:hypothetical protein
MACCIKLQPGYGMLQPATGYDKLQREAGCDPPPAVACVCEQQPSGG